MTVVWTNHARNRLGSIYDYIVTSAPGHAAPFCESLITATEQLAEHPLSGPILPEDGAYRQLVIDAYRLVYRVAAQRVYVMTIVAQRRGCRDPLHLCERATPAGRGGPRAL